MQLSLDLRIMKGINKIWLSVFLLIGTCVQGQTYAYDADPSSQVSSDVIYDAAVVQDGGFILLGGNRIIRTDSVMNIVWQTNFSMPLAVDYYLPLQVLVNERTGGFIVRGDEQSNTFLTNRTWLTEFDSSGLMSWMYVYETGYPNGGMSLLVQLSDGRLFAHITDSIGHDGMLFLDSAGNVDQRVIFQDSTYGGLVLPEDHGGFYMLGFSADADFTFYHMNSAGQPVYQRPYLFPAGWDFDQRQMTFTPDGNILVCGQYYTPQSPGPGYPALMKLDTLGNILWRKLWVDTSTTFYGSEFTDVAVTGTGEIYTLARFGQNADGRVFARFDMNGVLDTAFIMRSATQPFGYRGYQLISCSSNRVAVCGRLQVEAVQPNPVPVPGIIMISDTSGEICPGLNFPYTPVVVPNEQVLTNIPLPLTFPFNVTATTGSFTLDPVPQTQVVTGCYDDIFVGIPPVEQSAFSLFPNPVSIVLNVTVSEPYTVARILDVSGRIITEQPISGLSFELDVHALPAGLYILETESEGKLARAEFVKE